MKTSTARKAVSTPAGKKSEAVAPIAIPPLTVDLSEPKRQVALVIKQAGAITVTDDQSQSAAVALLSRVKTAQKQMTAAKASIVRPLNAARKAVFDLFRPIEEQAEAVESRLKHALSEYYDEQETARQKAEAKVQAALEAGRIRPATAERRLQEMPAPAKTVQGADGGRTTFTTQRRVEIYEPSEIPDEYWIVDEPRVARDVLSGNHVPGARVVTTTGVSAS